LCPLYVFQEAAILSQSEESFQERRSGCQSQDDAYHQQGLYFLVYRLPDLYGNQNLDLIISVFA
jgi:hypothetical protein